MANFENKDTPGNLDTNWQKGAYVKSQIDINSNEPSYLDVDCTALAFAWFQVQSNMKPSPKEEEERQQALKKQFELKVINKYGLPYGMPMSKETKEQIKALEEAEAAKSNKWQRKRQKLIQKQIEKDMKKQRAEEERTKFYSPNNEPTNSTMTPFANLSPTLLKTI